MVLRHQDIYVLSIGLTPVLKALFFEIKSFLDVFELKVKVKILQEAKRQVQF